MSTLEYLKEMEARLNKKIEELHSKIKLLGNACKQAFNQTKDVINCLTERQMLLNEDFCEMGGTIQDSTWI